VQPATEALAEMRKVLQSINKMTPTMEETLKDFRELSQTANKMAPDFQRTSEEFRALSKSARELIPEIKRTNDEVQVTVRTWGKVGERTDVLLKINEDKITRSIDQVETSLKRINDIFSEENQKNLRDTLRNVRNSSQQFETITRDTGELIKDSRVTVRQVAETMKKAESAIEDLQRTLKPFSGDKGAPPFFKSLDDTTTTLNLTLRDLRELVQVIGRSEGTVQKLITDPSLYNNLNDSALMVTKILPRLDHVLRDVEIFADKLARHPELIGIGGAIRPSTGLKEAPSSMPYRIFPRP
jgi:phospholipid/cholesterol/gamma-HCH transport system substrate-binding protein